MHDHVLRAADAIDGFDRLLTCFRPTSHESACGQNAIAVRQNEDMRKISA